MGNDAIRQDKVRESLRAERKSVSGSTSVRRGRFDPAVGKWAQALGRATPKTWSGPRPQAQNGVVANRDCLRAHGWGEPMHTKAMDDGKLIEACTLPSTARLSRPNHAHVCPLLRHWSHECATSQASSDEADGTVGCHWLPVPE